MEVVSTCDHSSETFQRAEVKPKSNVIPLGPCHVCGANSSGYHFGVISCEACKSFFRRTIKLNLKYTCLQDKSSACPLRQIKGQKPPCPACRFNKCLELGMAVHAIKRGRYSHAKRVETIQTSQNSAHRKSELILKSDRNCMLGDQGSVNPTSAHSEGYSTAQYNNAQSEPQHLTTTSKTQNSGFQFQTEQRHHPQGDVSQLASKQKFSPEPPAPHQYLKTDAQHISTLSDARNEADAAMLTMQKNTAYEPLNFTSNSWSCKSEITRGSVQQFSEATLAGSSANHFSLKKEIRSSFARSCNTNKGGNVNTGDNDLPFWFLQGDSDMEAMIEKILLAYDHQNFATFGFTAKVPISIHNYLISKQREFPKQRLISREEHRRIYEETGEDADGRLLSSFLHMARIFEHHIKKMSVYLLKLPGFKSLNSDDRCAIVKGRGQIMSLAYQSYVYVKECEEEMFITDVDGKLEIVSFETLAKMHTEQLTKSIFDLKRRWIELDLTDKEDALFIAVFAVYEAEHVSEEGKLKCDALHACFMLCLRKTLAQRRSEIEVKETLSKITDFIQYIVDFTKVLHTESEKVAAIYQSFLNKASKLAYEVISK